MKKLTSLQFFISKIQKKKISSVLEEKLMQKLEEKALKKSWNNWTARLARAANLARVEGLASKKPTAKPKCVLSVKSHTKHDFSVKIKLPGAEVSFGEVAMEMQSVWNGFASFWELLGNAENEITTKI